MIIAFVVLSPEFMYMSSVLFVSRERPSVREREKSSLNSMISDVTFVVG